MEIAKIAVGSTTGCCLSRQRIPAGIVGATVSVSFTDPVWDDLEKTVVFRCDDSRIAEFDGETAVVPWEVVTQPGLRLYFGIWGHNPQTGLQIPLIEVYLGATEVATDPGADPGTDPTLPIWGQLEARIDNAINNVSGDLQKIRQDIAEIREDMKYVAIDITSISSTVTKAEMGSAVNNVTISWAVNKTPKAQTLDGASIAVDQRSVALTGQRITANKTFTVKVTDERNATDTATTSISFLNGVYYGAAAKPITLDSAFIRGLTKELSNTRGRLINVDAGEGKNIWYALPVRLGACAFTVGGFSGGFELVDTIPFTNASGYTESYYVYASAKTGLGETKVVVS